MRRWILASIAVVAFGLNLSADEPPMPIAPPKPVAPPADAATPGTPAVIIPEMDWPTHPGAAGCSTCGPQTKIGQKINAHFSRPRPAPECLYCGTIPCEWRFVFGSCRAFFDEGRFAPALPAIPPH
jgi:hypothetical protein